MKRKNKIDQYVSDRIREARLKAGISQTALAEALELTFQQVQKYEKGSNRISAGRLALIAETVGMPVSWFFPENTTPKADDPLRQLGLTRDGIAVARAFVAIKDDDVRHQMRNVLQIVAGGDVPLRAGT